MNNLDELKSALITVLFYYHQDLCKTTGLDDESSVANNPQFDNDWENIQSQDIEPAFLHSPSDLEADLKRLIHEATYQNPTRLPVLQYIMDLILLLNQVTVTDEVPVDAVALFDKLNDSLVQFFAHMQCLNQTYHLKAVPIVYSDKTVSMSGFSMSRSKLAAHLTSLVLEPFGTEARQYMAKIDHLIAKQKTVFGLVSKPSAGEQTGQVAPSENQVLVDAYDKLSIEHEQLKQDHALQLSVNSQLREEKASLLDEFSALLMYCKQLEQKVIATTQVVPVQQIRSVSNAASIGLSRLCIFNAPRASSTCAMGVEQVSTAPVAL